MMLESKILLAFISFLLLNCHTSGQSHLGIGLSYSAYSKSMKDLDLNSAFGVSLETALQLKAFPRLPVYPGCRISYLMSTPKSGSLELEFDGLLYDTDLHTNATYFVPELFLRFLPLHKSSSFKPYFDLGFGAGFHRVALRYSYTAEDQEEPTRDGQRLARNSSFFISTGLGLIYENQEIGYSISAHHAELPRRKYVDFDSFEFITEDEASFILKKVRPAITTIRFSIYAFLQ